MAEAECARPILRPVAASTRAAKIPWGVDSGRSCGRLRLRSDSLWRLPMSLDPHEEPAAIQTHIGAIFISLELSRSKWLITSLVPGGGQKMSKHWVDAGDLAGLLARFWSIRDKASARMGISYPIIVIQEAGLDGFWIHRALVKEGIERATWWTRPRSRFRGVVDAPRPTRSMARGCCGRCWRSRGASRGCVRWCGFPRRRTRTAAGFVASARR